jgi:hypothetical protein
MKHPDIVIHSLPLYGEEGKARDIRIVFSFVYFTVIARIQFFASAIGTMAKLRTSVVCIWISRKRIRGITSTGKSDLNHGRDVHVESLRIFEIVYLRNKSIILST